MKEQQITWDNGDESRPLNVYRPCPCGCDARGDGIKGVGYISGSDQEGNGFTIWIENEDVYQRVRQVIGKNKKEVNHEPKGYHFSGAARGSIY